MKNRREKNALMYQLEGELKEGLTEEQYKKFRQYTDLLMELTEDAFKQEAEEMENRYSAKYGRD